MKKILFQIYFWFLTILGAFSTLGTFFTIIIGAIIFGFELQGNSYISMKAFLVVLSAILICITNILSLFYSLKICLKIINEQQDKVSNYIILACLAPFALWLPMLTFLIIIFKLN